MEKPLPKKGVVYGMTLLIIVILLALLGLFYLTQHDTIKTFSLVLFVIVFILGSVYVYVRLTSKKVRMHRHLQDFEKQLLDGDLEYLKKKYQLMHNHYLKLKEKHREQFFHAVENVHRKLEEMMVAEHKLQQLVDVKHKDTKKQHKVVLEMHEHFNKLPKKTQEKYHHVLVYAKKQL